MAFFPGKMTIIAGGLATLVLSFQLGVFYGPERRDALYSEYSGAGRIAAIEALRPAVARIAESAVGQVQAAGFITAPSRGPEVRGEYGRPMVVTERRTCDTVAPTGPAPFVVTGVTG